MTIIAINRDPEDGEVEVPAAGAILFDIIGTAGEVIDTAALTVDVAGGPAIIAGAFQAGFSGTIDVIAASSVRVTVQRAVAFDSLQLVVVDAATTGFSDSWSFTIEDLTAPEILTVVAQSRTVLEVTFNEPITTGLAELGNYALTAPIDPNRLVPAVGATFVALTVTTDSQVLLTTSRELTHGVTYTLTVADVADANGNVIAPPGDTATFLGFTPKIPSGRRWDLFYQLPQKNREEDITRDLQRFIACFQEVVDHCLFDIDAWTDILDPDKADEAYLDAMLCDLGNPFDFPLVEVDKRRLLRVLVDIYRQKGTARGIKNAVRFFLGFEVALTPADDGTGMELGISELGVDWELGIGDQRLLYTFDVTVVDILTDEQRSRLFKIIDLMKPAHTHVGSVVEPTVPEVFDHWEVGESEMGETTLLH